MLRNACPAQRNARLAPPATVALPDDTFPHGFQWHPLVHQSWGSEALWFSFLAFEPMYKQGKAVAAVEKTLRDLEIRSYAIYELTGQYDMLVRAWVPLTASYEARMEQVAKPGSVSSVRVSEIVHHWVWQQTERSPIGEMRSPHEDLNARPPVIRELEILNTIQRRMAAEGPQVVLSQNEMKLLNAYKSRKLITEPPYEDGIKFIVQVKVDERKQTVDQRDTMMDEIAEALDDARDVIWDRSMYFCRGHIQFIVLGRVRLASTLDPTMAQSGPFHEITPRLLQKFSRIASAGGTKTYTYFFPLPGFLAFKDELPVPEAPAHPRPVFDRLFATEESHEFEAKATAFSEVDQWLKGRGEIVTSKDPTNNSALMSLLSAVASLLNTGDGTVLLGALESRVYGNHERAKQLPKVGKYLCLGLESDAAHYDEFARALWDVLDDKITPSPLRWLKLWSHDVDNKTVAAITIREPDEWFWVKYGRQTKFIVRRGASTRELHGPDITEYQDNHPRRRGPTVNPRGQNV